MSSAPSKVGQTLHQIEGTSGGQVTLKSEDEAPAFGVEQEWLHSGAVSPDRLGVRVRKEHLWQGSRLLVLQYSRDGDITKSKLLHPRSSVAMGSDEFHHLPGRESNGAPGPFHAVKCGTPRIDYPAALG